MKKVNRKLRHSLGWIVLKSLGVICGFVPLSLNLLLGRMLGRVLFGVFKRKREIILRGLGIAFPEMSEAKRKALAHKNVLLMGQAYLETFYYLQHPAELKNIRIEGRQYLDQALQNNSGVIGLTGHFGNFTLLHYKLAYEGYPVAVVLRPMRDKQAHAYFQDLCDRLTIKTIYTLPKKQAALQILRSLRLGDLVIIQMDQDFRDEGIWVQFFNKTASTASGPVVFALRTGVSILPMYIVRTGHKEHLITIEPPYQLQTRASKQETIQHNVQSLTKRIEEWVRLYPEQWGWMNDRWRTIPVNSCENNSIGGVA